MAEPSLDQILGPLFDAFVEGDDATLTAVVDRYVGILADAADELAHVPDSLRQDAEGSKIWVHFVVTVAQLLAERGHDTLLVRVMGPANNPIARWQEALAQAQQLRDEGWFAASDVALGDIVDELRSARGTAVDSMLGKALGISGANALERGDVDRALRLTDEALRECERTGDEEGVEIYSQNLATISALADDRDRSATVRERLSRAQMLHDRGRLLEARDRAAEVVDELLRADADARRYLAKACGLLGMILYRLDDLPGARDHTAAAIAAGREAGDDVAVVIYTANLDVIDRHTR